MKAVIQVVETFLCLGLLAGVVPAQENRINYDQVALQKWHVNNIWSVKLQGPDDLLFDGENFWAADGSAGTVSKIRASDGAVLGTFNTGRYPLKLEFDGANIWVVDDDGSLTKLRASDGVSLATIRLVHHDLGTSARTVTFDGANIWVGADEALWKLRPSDGAVLDRIGHLSRVGDMLFDGTNLLLCTNGYVQSFDPSSRQIRWGSVVDEHRASCFSMTYDGVNLWMVDARDGLLKVRASDGVVEKLSLKRGGPVSLTFDGNYLWAGDQGRIVKLRPSDGAELAEYPLFDPAAWPGILAFDGVHIWAALRDVLIRL